MNKKTYILAILLSILFVSFGLAAGSAKITAKAENGTALLKTDKAIYEEGEAIMVTACAKNYDWVGIYEKDDTDILNTIRTYYIRQGDTDYYNKPCNIREAMVGYYQDAPSQTALDLQYLPGADSGDGIKEYSIYLMKSGSKDLSDPIAKVDIKIRRPLLELEKTDFLYNERIMVKAAGTSGWVGIYKTELVKQNPSGVQDNHLVYYYVSNGYGDFGDNGCVDIRHDVKDVNDYIKDDSFTAGNYSLFRFNSGAQNFSEAISRIDIKIHDEDLYTDKRVYRHNERIMVKAIAGSHDDWIGIYEKGENNIHNVIKYYTVSDALTLTDGLNCFDKCWGFADIRHDGISGSGTAAQLFADLQGGSPEKVYTIHRFHTDAESMDDSVGSTDITILSEEVLSTDSYLYQEGQPIIVTAYDGGAFTTSNPYTDHVAIYSEDSGSSIYYAYFNSEKNGGKDYFDDKNQWKIKKDNGILGWGGKSDNKLAELPAGKYAICLIPDDGGRNDALATDRKSVV